MTANTWGPELFDLLVRSYLVVATVVVVVELLAHWTRRVTSSEEDPGSDD